MTKKSKNLLIAILLVSILLRVGAAFYFGNQVVELPGTFDQISYHQLALRVSGGHGFSFGEQWWPITKADAPTAHWSFLYTLYLALVYTIFGPNPLMARILQAIIAGALLPWMTYKLGKYLFSEAIGLIAAGISAVYIYFVYYAATLMTESFYILAILASLYMAMLLVETNRSTEKWQKVKYALLLGLIAGIAVLLRQLFMLFVPFLFLWVWWSGRKTGTKSLIPALVLAAVIIVTMILPFTIYNYARFDRFVLLNTNSGYAFFWGNHPIYGTHFEPILPPEMGSYQELIPQEVRSLDEAALEQELLKRGIQFILDDPGRYILLSLSRIPPYFMFWPSPDSGTISNISRVFSFGLLWPFMLYGLIRVPFWKEAKFKFKIVSPYFLVYLFIFIYALIHIMTWTLIRYRLPIDALLVIFSAIPLYEGFHYFSGRKALKA
ncbi:MAG TPA: hypothetical protein DEH22_16025 [Chloroflexi bacterium]|nr:hypothetical protein [Chloroflexota bacterium]